MTYYTHTYYNAAFSPAVGLYIGMYGNNTASSAFSGTLALVELSEQMLSRMMRILRGYSLTYCIAETGNQESKVCTSAPTFPAVVLFRAPRIALGPLPPEGSILLLYYALSTEILAGFLRTHLWSQIILSPPLENFRDPGSRSRTAVRDIAPPCTKAENLPQGRYFCP